MIIPIDINKKFNLNDDVVYLKEYMNEVIYVTIGEKFKIISVGGDKYDILHSCGLIIRNVYKNEITYNISYKSAVDKIKKAELETILLTKIEYTCVYLETINDINHSDIRCTRYGGESRVLCSPCVDCLKLELNKPLLYEVEKSKKYNNIIRKFKLQKLLDNENTN